jgi:glycogen(starch) synthase
MTMRVLMLSWEYPPHVVGGLGKHIADLAPALADEQIELHIITPQLQGGMLNEQTSEGIYVYRVPPPNRADETLLTLVLQTNLAMEHIAHELWQRYGGFDVIHAHDWLAATAGIALKHAWHIPLIATIHATERGRNQGYLSPGSESERINNIEWRLCYEAWRVIVCSDFMLKQLQDYFGVPEDKIDVVPNGVHVPQNPFSSEQERAVFRLRYAQTDQPLVYSVGRAVYEKGFQVLLDAWPAVLERFPKARLVIAGIGAYLPALQQRAQQLGIAQSVTFAGFISDETRDQLYHVADVAVFPSLYEPFGIVALEAMATGCPVVVTATGGFTEVVMGHETGMIAQPHNPASLAWVINHTLEHPHWTQIRAENALDSIKRLYNWQTIANSTHAVYLHSLKEWQKSDWGKTSLFRRGDLYHNVNS